MRLPSVIAIAVASLYLVSMAARWVDSRAAFHTALITQGILALNVGGLLATPDGLQAAAWAAAAYHVARAYENHGWAQWLTSGLWFGVGMLSKYTMVIFLLAAFGYGLFSPLHRRRLASIRPYVGGLIGGLMFMPVVIWNATHGLEFPASCKPSRRQRRGLGNPLGIFRGLSGFSGRATIADRVPLNIDGLGGCDSETLSPA